MPLRLLVLSYRVDDPFKGGTIVESWKSGAGFWAVKVEDSGNLKCDPVLRHCQFSGDGL